MNLPEERARKLFTGLVEIDAETHGPPDLIYTVESEDGGRAQGMIVTVQEDGGLILNVDPGGSNRQETVVWDKIARVSIEVEPQ